MTVAGGVVLDPSPGRHRGDGRVLHRLRALERGDPESIVASALAGASGPLDLERLARPGVLGVDQARAALGSLEQRGAIVALGAEAWIDPGVLAAIRSAVGAALELRAADQPLQPGLPIASMLPPTGRAALVRRLSEDGTLVLDGSRMRAPRAPARAADVHELAAATVLAALESSPAVPPSASSLVDATRLPAREFDALIAALERDGAVVRLGDQIIYLRQQLVAARDWVERCCRETGTVTLTGLRDELGTSRRVAQAILERLDADGVTRRVGDARVLRRRRTPDTP